MCIPNTVKSLLTATFHGYFHTIKEPCNNVCVCVCVCVCARAYTCARYVTSRLQPSKLLCPWDSPGKSTGVGCHALLQEIFPTQGLNPCLLGFLHWLVDSLLPVPPVKTFDTMLCYAKSLQSCLTLCNPIHDSPPGSPVPGILQARTLEWAAISFSNA